jgi:hypothetical protein
MSNILSKIGATIAHEATAAAHFIENLLGADVGQTITKEAASIVTGILIKASVSDPAERTKVADYVYSVSSGIYTLSTGQLPTVSVLTDYLHQFTDGSALLASVVSALSDEYAKLYATLEKDADAAKAIAFFNALAAGVEEGAKTYADSATTGVASA